MPESPAKTAGDAGRAGRVVRIWRGVYFRTLLQTSERIKGALVATLLENTER